MLSQLLNSTVQDGLLTFVLGMLVTFLGIAVIIFFIKLLGYIISKPTDNKEVKETIKSEPVVEEVKSNDLPLQVKAAIIAAITAYYYNAEPTKKCDFVVKKIKRL